MDEERKRQILSYIGVDHNRKPGAGSDGDEITEEDEKGLPTWPDEKEAERLLMEARIEMDRGQ